MRKRLAGLLFRTVVLRAGRPTPDELEARALVVAPHPDDETLGCGGTVIAKRAAGAEIGIVVMTDGSRSHAAFVPEAELSRRREAELVAAAEKLGVARSALSFLGFPDQQLARHEERAVAELSVHIERFRPRQIFVPFERDPQIDHLATRRVVASALGRAGGDCVAWEYPVWLWSQWPFAPMPKERRLRARLPALVESLRGLRAFDLAVPIAAHLERKREALAAHATQVARPDDRPDWPILGEVAEGEFLPNFFREFELFRRVRAVSA